MHISPHRWLLALVFLGCSCSSPGSEQILTEFEWYVYPQHNKENKDSLDTIVASNRSKQTKVLRPVEAIIKLQEKSSGYYRITSITSKENTKNLQLNPKFFPNMGIKVFQKNGLTVDFEHKTLGSHNAAVANEYLMFWSGRPVFMSNELNQKIQNSAEKFLEKNENEFTDKEKNKLKIIEGIDLFTLGFSNLGKKYGKKDFDFPREVRIAFPGTVNRLCDGRKVQAINIIREIWKEYPDAQLIFEKLWNKADRIGQARYIQDWIRGGLSGLWSFKWKIISIGALLALAVISLYKLGAFLWDRSLQYLFPISYLPTSVLKQYTREKNGIIRWVDRYLGPAQAQWVRRFMEKRGWWRPLPRIRVDLVIYPNDLTQEYVEGLLEDIRYIIKANKALIAEGEAPIYFLPNVIFYGKPGNGKTRICQMIISMLRAEGLIESCEVNIPQLVKLDVRESGLFWEEISTKESAERPLGIILNEFDDVALNRYGLDTNAAKRTHLNSFLSLFDEKGSPYRFCLMTMNTDLNDGEKRRTIDTAFLSRAKEFKIAPPHKENRIRILLLHLREQGKAAGFFLTDIAFLKEELAKHPLFDCREEGRYYAAIANEVIIKKTKERRNRLFGQSNGKKGYIVLQDILAVLDRALSIITHNEDHPATS